MFRKNKWLFFSLGLLMLTIPFALFLTQQQQENRSKANTLTANYYVSPTGNDTNNGSASSPFRTIQKAASLVQAGNLVYIRSGTYGTFTVQSKNGTSASPITFAAYPGEERKAIVDNNNVTSGTGIKIKDSSYITIAGLGVTESQKGIFVDNSKYVVLQNNNVFNLGMEAIHLMRNSAFIKVINNEIHNLGNSNHLYSEGIYVGNGSYPGSFNVTFPDNTHDILIKGNHIYNADKADRLGGEPINVKGETYNVTIEDNLIHDFKVPTGGGISFDTQNGWDVSFDRKHIVRNNIIYNITDDTPYGDANGISVKAQHVTIYNNILYNNADYGIRISDTQNVNQLVKIYNNTIKPGVGKDGITAVSGADYVANNNIGTSLAGNLAYTDGLFLNSPGNDYHLKAGSAAIDKGTIVGVTSDKDGLSRPQGSAYDIGAYEYTASSVSLVPSISSVQPSTTPTQTPSPVITTSQSVVSFTVIRSDTKATIQALANGSTMNLATLPTRSINVIANTNPQLVESVQFFKNGVTSYRTENNAPYELEGDGGAWIPTVGTHTIEATPYTGSAATGTSGTPLTITFSVTDTSTPSITPTKTPIPVIPTNTPAPTQTPIQNSTSLSITVKLHGIGTGGDVVNPSSTGNQNPVNPTRNITAEMYQASTNTKVADIAGTVNYDSASGTFKGTLNAPSTITTNGYNFRIKSDRYLITQLLGVSITQNSINTIPTATLTAGDINSDDALDILDYNILVSCYGANGTAKPTSCINTNNQAADLYDDGNVNFIDLNLWLREFSRKN